jgi:beta-lactamase regulating signal transducer with metallopeptidase domain
MSLVNRLMLELSSIRGGALTPVFGLLIDTALKGSLLIIASAIAAYLLRGRSASARHAAWSAAVVGHLALPVMTLLAPQWRLPVLPAPPWLDAGIVAPVKSATPAASGVTQFTPQAPSATTSPIKAPAPQINSSATSANAVKAEPATQSQSAAWPLISLLGLMWLLGGLLVLVRLAYGTWRVGQLAKQGDRVADGDWVSLAQRLANRLGITRPLTLLRGESLAVPVTWGVVYPAVLLPPDADEWPEARRRFVLVHEMAHVKRFDALTQLLAQFAIALFWFDPLIWLAAHKMRVEREHACDDYVLRDGTAPSLYAGELLEMVQSIGSPRHESAAPAFAALAMARRSEFEGRMLAILDPKQERHTLGRRSTIAASIALALLVLPLAALRPFHSASVSGANANLSNAAPPSSRPIDPLTYPLLISDRACDSAWRAHEQGTSTHTHADDDGGANTAVEYLSTDKQHCMQARIIGKATFLDDHLTSLVGKSYAAFRQVDANGEKSVRITSDPGGALRYTATRDDRPAVFDDSLRTWLDKVTPEVLREASIDVPQRVARYMKHGGVDAVLAEIDSVSGMAGKRAEYEALLRTPSLTSAQYDKIARHAGRDLASSPTDLSAVLTLLSGGLVSTSKSISAAAGNLVAAQTTMTNALGTALRKSTSSSDSASTLTQYAQTDDPEMILMAIHGARDISSDTDKRLLLESIAPKALVTKNARLRTAFFDASATFHSDDDLRLVLQTALDYAAADPAITLAAFSLVADKMTSDTNRRLVLMTAAEKHLLTTSAIRNAYTAAAKKMTSSTDYVITMQAILNQ